MKALRTVATFILIFSGTAFALDRDVRRDRDGDRARDGDSYECRYDLTSSSGSRLDTFYGEGSSRVSACQEAQYSCYNARRFGETCQQGSVTHYCLVKVKTHFSDGVGTEINERNHPGNPKNQCNTSCHWAGYELGCATTSCNVVVVGGRDGSLCRQCRYEKEVEQRQVCY